MEIGAEKYVSFSESTFEELTSRIVNNKRLLSHSKYNEYLKDTSKKKELFDAQFIGSNKIEYYEEMNIIQTSSQDAETKKWSKMYTIPLKGKVTWDKTNGWTQTEKEKYITNASITFVKINEEIMLAKIHANEAVPIEEKERAEEELNQLAEETERILKGKFNELGIAMGYDSNDERNIHENYKNVLDDTSYYEPEETQESDTANKTVGSIIGVITSIGIIVSVLVPAIVGVKYMIASASEKADYKKDMIPYLIGAVLLFGISLVVKILQGFGNSFNS